MWNTDPVQIQIQARYRLREEEKKRKKTANNNEVHSSVQEQNARKYAENC
jgi:hypothetical protein